MLRITAVSAGAVDYLVRGSGCVEPAEAEDSEAAEAGSNEGGGAAYLQEATSHGEPRGRWFGSGLQALGLSAESGDLAEPDDVRAVFGQLRDPRSSDDDPVFLGRPPRRYRSPADRLAEALAEEPVDPLPERRRELELASLRSARKAVAYYDFTFSAPKSVSVYWAALIAAGAVDQADLVAAAHDRAVAIAIEYAESRIAYTRTGYHGRTAGGESVGKHEPAVGTAWTMWRHSTSRSGDPQLHTHAALLNRVATAAGHIGALDGRAFAAYKEAISTAYERALEQLVTEACDVEFALRGDGLAREIVGVDPTLIAEASTRRAQVVERIDDLIREYVERHGHEPDARARKAMADMATLDTRVAKGAEPGPAQVAAWGAARVERLIDMLDEVETVGGYAPAAARGGHSGTAPKRSTEIDAVTVASAIADVQARYSVWTVGNLARAVDAHLGPASALGADAADRPALLDRLVRQALESPEVVTVTVPDPVEVPVELQRPDGTPLHRRANGARYSTLAHLSMEERVLHQARAQRAPRLLGADLETLRIELVAAGLSSDQVDAVAGLISSGRAGEVLVGPAGAGKSHAVRALAHAWSDRFEQRVLGVATSENATRNLAGDGLEAINAARFLMRFAPDHAGHRAERVRPGDLVVVDEAAMSDTATLAQITDLVVGAGGKVVFTGDHQQLDSVGAGGLFAHLVRQVGAHELTEVHRFAAPWEADASLRLRGGDHEAIPTYVDHGRLRRGTLEQMQEQASRAYLGDVLAGKDTLLIVGTNAHATELSAAIREELIRLRRVSPDTVVIVDGDQPVSVGDRIQARLNDRRLRVDAPPDRVARPVTNRALYTVVGHDPVTGNVLARDDQGATAHLPTAYCAEHVTLAYAVTGYAAQGVTVDTGHPIVDHDTTREQLYPMATRGRERNTLYLVTDRAPDLHDQEPVHDQAVARLAAVLDRTGRQEAAGHVREQGELDAASLAMVATAWDAVVSEHARERYASHLSDVLGEERAVELRGEAGYPRLLRALRESELRGHDPHALVTDAAGRRSLGDAESVADVLRWRVRGEAAGRSPEQTVDPRDWTTRARPLDGAVGQYVQQLAVLATDRQEELGRRIADAAPRWAVRHLGPPPEPDAVERAEWEQRAGIAAAYREMHAIPDEQDSLGPAPSREHEFHRQLWEQARDALGRPADAVDPAALSDAELYEMRERWAREQHFAPEYVADALRETSQSAHEHRVDAHLLKAELEALEPDDPRRAKLEAQAGESFRSVEELDRAVAELESSHERRASWWASHSSEECDARLASEELDSRGVSRDRPASVVSAPDREIPAPSAPDVDLDRVDDEPDNDAGGEAPVLVTTAPSVSAARERDAERRGREHHREYEVDDSERERRDAAEELDLSSEDAAPTVEPSYDEIEEGDA